MEGYETASWRGATQKAYYYDAPNQLFRVDTNSGSGTTAVDGSFQMYSNFTSGIEYYYNTVTGTCDLYGLNYWADWCYGSVNSQTPVTTISMAGEICDVWGMDGSDFTWTNQRGECIPVGSNRATTGETTVFRNYKVGPVCPKMFELPAACVDASARFTGDVKSLPPLPSKHR